MPVIGSSHRPNLWNNAAQTIFLVLVYETCREMPDVRGVKVPVVGTRPLPSRELRGLQVCTRVSMQNLER
jgi:hypothetical protein